MKKYAMILALALVIVLASTGIAYANFGPHGGYSGDTDACAGCHRAHTSFSPIQRTEYSFGEPTGDVIGSALLVSSAAYMTEFCDACHGADAPGASTNVVEGIFDSGPSADVAVTVGDPSDTTGGDGGEVDPTLYQTNSVFEATLNGGGFSTMIGDTTYPNAGTSVSSAHSMYALDTNATDINGYTAPMWGFGSSVTDADATLAEFTCTSCHDPHGSSNYRLLKDTLPGGAVGGYTLAGLPDPYVISSEAGYPANGWEKHVNPNTGGYVPDYTTPRYRNNGNMAENISGWCAGCHEKYTESGTMYDYDKYMAAGTTELPATTIYYRHPVNRVVADITSSSLAVEPTRSDFLPLEVDQAAAAESDWALGDMIGCLTCHRAHGTNVFMSGWSESSLSFETGREPEWSVALDDGSGGTNPNKSSALLRLDNRGVCERCHDK